ncbi:MAG: hypothetical protein OEX22_12695, partial [Cyclobacteriaceae bacterium]|nr:hypothetical protein [Cyclobacteriaceae bacterium]
MLKSIIHIGVSENDNRETVEIKRIAIVMGMLMSLAAAIWGVILIYHKEYLFAIIPFGYVTVTIFNLITLNVSKKISVPRFVQLFFSISLPFILQWLLGGFISSGGMMLWSLIGLV